MASVPFVIDPDKRSANGSAITQAGEVVDLFGRARSVTPTDRLWTRRHDLVRTVRGPISCGWTACFRHRLFRIGFQRQDAPARQPGTTLGPYEVTAQIGQGGMGEVYQARDTRLDRTDAIKVLPAHVAADPDLKQRFEREAKTISSLNHPA